MKNLFFRRGKRGAGRSSVGVIPVLALSAGLVLAGSAAVFAQEEGGPTPEEISAFERDFAPAVPEGGPDESQIERPRFEEPGKISGEIRNLVPETDLVAVYCAMTRWKSGTFFAAMDAVQTLIVPATEKLKILGINVVVPDTAELKSLGEAKVDAVCAAKTVDEADRLVREFMAWGQSAGESRFAALRTDMKTKIQTVADQMRADIKTDLDPFIQERKATISAEINARAQELADQKSARFAAYTKEPSAAEIAAVKAEITGELQSLIDQKKAAVKSAVEAKVKEIVGPRQERIEAAAGAFKGMEAKMNEAIRSGSAKYDSYKEEAISLRLKLVLGILDKSVAEGLKELDARSADIEEARQGDSGVPSVPSVKAEIAQSRKTLESKLDTALRAGDEAAFQEALNGFRAQWEEYRMAMQKAAEQSVGKICAVATAQFGQARGQINSQLAKLKAIESKCAGLDTDECLKVNEFGPRFGILEAKLDDIILEMGVAEKMCVNPESADQARFTALLNKIRSDADELKVYGEALEAEKVQVIAESAAGVCIQVLPQLRAGLTEIRKNEVAELETEIAKCKKTGEGICKDKAVTGGLARLKPLIDAFTAGTERAEALCRAPDEERFAELRDLLQYLKSTAEKLREEVQTLKADADRYGRPTMADICGSARASLDIARRGMSLGLAEMAAVSADCRDDAGGRCAAIAGAEDKMEAVRQKVGETLGQIAAVEARCGNPGHAEVDDAFVAELNGIRDAEAVIKKMESELKSAVDLTWPNYFKSGKSFKAVLDAAPSKFDDSAWTGDGKTDQMGTIKGGETYTVAYSVQTGWKATGFNEGTGAVGTWTYVSGDPDGFQLNIWGRVFDFDDRGNVYDPDFGLVGHLTK